MDYSSASGSVNSIKLWTIMMRPFSPFIRRLLTGASYTEQ